MRKRFLITGGCGFIGHHMVEYLLETNDCNIVVLDRLDVSGNLNRLTELPIWEKEKNRVSFVWHDMKSELHNNEVLMSMVGSINTILHIGASSHVDRSISDPMSFVMDNVVGTCNMLNFARTQNNLENFVYFSTDEVFGPAPVGIDYKEDARYNSGNPYAASKAGGEELAVSFHNTYKLPVMITHCMNVFGERQHPEKFIPLCIKNSVIGKKVFIHANKNLTKAGSRYYIHAKNVCNAVDFLLTKGTHGEKYNIVGEKEVDNLTLAKMISSCVGKNLECELVDFHSSRPGHDLRYALDGSKMANLGWAPQNNLEQSIQKVVDWSLNNKKWIGL